MKRASKKERLDLLLGEIYPGLSRSRVRAEIMAGKVRVDGVIRDKPGTPVARDSSIALVKPENPYVSRGGLKLEGALDDLGLVVEGLVVLDVGASTGGFTDCLLKRGARLVFALDVGYGQLDSKLRSNPRVVVMERFNVRNLTASDLPVLPDMVVIDVSFISLSLVVPVTASLGISRLLALVKPQFEVGRADAARGRGVVRSPELHREVLEKTCASACRTGYCLQAATYSRWPGPKGNLEFFLYCTLGAADSCSCLPGYGECLRAVVESGGRFLESTGKA